MLNWRVLEPLILHTSDLHLASSDRQAGSAGDLRPLEVVLEVARRQEVDVVLLSGDTFDHNRAPAAFLARVRGAFQTHGQVVVILPGNHDPLTPGNVYERGGFGALPNVHVLGETGDGLGSVVFAELDLEIWGRAHLDYVDMVPLDGPRPRKARWQIAAAHGHVDPSPPDAPYRPSWLISPRQIEATQADYVALGHWNRRVCVSAGNVIAYYSGSPDYAGTVNIVRFSSDGHVHVAYERVTDL
jgi:DNA repair exonuclease SbcCD nuclease subunit